MSNSSNPVRLVGTRPSDFKLVTDGLKLLAASPEFSDLRLSEVIEVLERNDWNAYATALEFRAMYKFVG